MYTRSQYDDLVEAISLGVRKVQHGNKIIEYDSLNSMIRRARAMAKELGIGEKDINFVGGRAYVPRVKL